MLNPPKKSRASDRRGAVLMLVLISLMTLVTFVALAIDLGMLAVARTQCQDAADAAAMAGARTLNGVAASNNNYSNAAPNAIQTATSNYVLSQAITSGQVAVDVGRYVYVGNNQRFEGQFPGPSNENWSLVRATINNNVGNRLAFSRAFNFTGGNLQVVATAAHRPRDICVVLDYSGSMRFGSLTGISSGSSPYSGTRSLSNNPDSVYPTFGHYSSGSAGLQATSFTTPYDPANITSTSPDGRSPIVADFYTDAGGTRAFTAAPASYATTPAGDQHLKVNNNTGASWCTTVKDLLNITVNTATPKNTTFENNGYSGIVGNFAGYTQGPGYWGKSFFIWPPDPRPAYDWRAVYFNYGSGLVPADYNSKLWNTSGVWQAPSSSTYTIDYAAILNFIKNVGPNPFPSRLQSGRILYYDQIPSSISSTYPPSNMNERFWKDYIDYVLGVVQTGSSSYTAITGYTGYGTDYAFGTTKITAKSSLTGSPLPYMYYLDNPQRPKTHFWFGPLTMIDFLGNYNLWNASFNSNNQRYGWWPGTCHESPMYACKLGIRTALSDISNNHPNNLVSLITFAAPSQSNGDGGRFNRVRVGLSRDYASMQDALWYPPATIGNASATVRPYDADNLEVPRAMGGTCYSMALMLAYNQFSANTSLLNYNTGAAAGDAGGNGRKGAQKIVIFETDGSPTSTATATLNNLGAYNSYYSIRYNSSSPGASEFPTVATPSSSTVTTQINSLCTQLCALDTASPPGYSTPSKKVQIHCIGFGPVFASGSSTRATAISVLDQMQRIGNITDGMPDYKIIYGTEAQMTADLQQAFTQILQSGVQVTLIQ